MGGSFVFAADAKCLSRCKELRIVWLCSTKIFAVPSEVIHKGDIFFT
jgi:hypothetical protein